ncbi:hypothetical protein TWF506_003727 [Arthrobotrys conoides]|uniref:Uncharacterized protein n=1 Tax=Arthrobotrys conoides TaxID=74498 RepID=A0AAN8NH10_9PEZI
MHNVSGLLSYGLEFCSRSGVNSAQRLNIGFGKSASGGSDDDTSASSASAAPVKPTPNPEPEAISSADPIPVVTATVSTSITEVPPVAENTPTIEPTIQDGVPTPVSVEPTTLIVVSTTTSAQVVETTSSVLESIPSTKIGPSESLEIEFSSISLPTETTKSRTPSGWFSLESSSKLDTSNTDLVVIQTADPVPTNTRSAATTAPESTSAPPTPTADEPSSASASVLHMFGQGSFNSFVLCLLALFFVF